MANKWRSTLTEANAVFEKYSVSPSELSDETLLRKWTGVDRSVVATLVATLRATATVTSPKADGQTYSGTWGVGQIEVVNEDGGALAGSATIFEPLKKSYNVYATPDNISFGRNRAYPFEQNENAWMYYERFKTEETKRWCNITKAGLDDEVWDHVRQIRTYTLFAAAVTADADVYPGGWAGGYYHRKFLYAIFYNDTLTGSAALIGATAPVGGWVVGKYYTPATATWQSKLAGQPESWFFDAWEEITTPVIREAYYEPNKDGTYDLYRSLEETSTISVMRTRPLQYAGMTLVSGSPTEGDGTITITGFLNQTEVIYANAQLRIGPDTYRVTANNTASSGTATSVAITPNVTQATEDLCAEYPNNVQVFWSAH